MRTWLQRALWDVVPRDHRRVAAGPAPPPGRHGRRSWSSAALVLGFSLRIEPGNALVLPRHPRAGGRLDGRRLRLRARCTSAGSRRRDRAAPAGRAADPARARRSSGVFVVGALVVRQVPFLDDQVRTVLDHADQGSVPLLVLITARQRGRRGAVLPRRAYAADPALPGAGHDASPTPLATLATGNVMLAFAARAARRRRRPRAPRHAAASSAPILTHVTWSLSMLFLLPLLFG